MEKQNTMETTLTTDPKISQNKLFENEADALPYLEPWISNLDTIRDEAIEGWII